MYEETKTLYQNDETPKPEQPEIEDEDALSEEELDSATGGLRAIFIKSEF
jgi:hypothetical protein